MASNRGHTAVAPPYSSESCGQQRPLINDKWEGYLPIMASQSIQSLVNSTPAASLRLLRYFPPLLSRLLLPRFPSHPPATQLLIRSSSLHPFRMSPLLSDGRAGCHILPRNKTVQPRTYWSRPFCLSVSMQEEINSKCTWSLASTGLSILYVKLSHFNTWIKFLLVLQ